MTDSPARQMYAPPAAMRELPLVPEPVLPVDAIMRRLTSIEPRNGSHETILGAMTDLIVADTGATRADIEVWHTRSIQVTSGDDEPAEGWLEAPLQFGSVQLGLVRIHGSHDQVEQWRQAGFPVLATHLGPLVMAHLSHGDAAAATSSRDHLIASVSHELRTPLTFISGIVTELLDHRSDITSAERVDLLELISDQSADMERIIEDLLAGAMVGADRLVLSIESLDLAEQARRVAETSRIELSSSPELGLFDALGDERRVRQILRNLLTNAERYGGRTITCDVFRDLRRGYVAVCDDGPPIPVEQRRHLFEDFYRVEATPHHPASVGIGLSVSRRLASLMGGSLGYEHDGRHSRFILGLPIAPTL